MKLIGTCKLVLLLSLLWAAAMACYAAGQFLASLRWESWALIVGQLTMVVGPFVCGWLLCWRRHVEPRQSRIDGYQQMMWRNGQ